MNWLHLRRSYIQSCDSAGSYDMVTLPWSGVEQLRMWHSSGRDPMRWTGLLNPRTSKRLCQPSSKASSILLCNMTVRIKQVDFSAFSCTYTTINYHCTTVTTPTTLAIMFIQEFDAINEEKTKIKMDDDVARFFTRFGGNLFICGLVEGAALSRRPRMR